jgi:acetylornithine deacetylase/succinyl-diaminopimelate desuccinylase-like protein
VEVPADRLTQTREAAKILGSDVHARYPWVPGARPVDSDVVQLLLNSTWRPALSITGAAGLPALEDAGNVLRPMTAVTISLRIPPTTDAARATRVLTELFESDPPYGARVRFTTETPSAGWDAPALAPWLHAALERASVTHFGKPPAFAGVGGSIPFMSMLGERFPRAQFVITGVLGPGSNAHGPNEFLHLPTGVRVTACVAEVLADHYRASRRG